MYCAAPCSSGFAIVPSVFGRGLRVIAINLALLSGGLIILELAFGSWFDPRPAIPVRVPRNVEIVFDATNYYPGGGRFVYRRDRYGLRGDYGSLSDIDVLAIGGSTTNELYVGEGQTWADVLAAEFRANGRAISVANAGVDGHSTVGHLRSFESWFPALPGLRPRYVLAYVGINDVHLELEENARYDSFLRDSAGERLRRYLRDNSALYEAYRVSIGLLRAKRTRLLHGSVDWGAAEWQEAQHPSELPDLKGRLAQLRDDFGNRLALLIDRIRDFGADAIIVTQHRATYRRSGDRLLVSGSGVGDYQVQTLFNARAMEVCRSRTAICIDLAAEIEFAIDDFQDYVHTTPQGSRRIGEFLHAKLKDVVR